MVNDTINKCIKTWKEHVTELFKNEMVVSLERVEFKISDMDDATKEVIEKPAPTSFTSRKYIIVKESFGELGGGESENY